LSDDQSTRSFTETVEEALAASARTRQTRIAATRRRQRRLLALCLVIGAVVAAIWAPRLHTDRPHAAATTTPPAARTIPDFVWVPAAGAAGYRVEFLDGGRVILTRTTKGARLHVDASRLAPGTYRWRVWALNGAGARIGAPIVDASVKVA
jgi:hypothetical protein